MPAKKSNDFSIKDSIDHIHGWLHTAIEMGMSLILVMVVIDVLFPGTTGVVNNLSMIVGQFSKEGIAGLIALLLFLMVFRGREKV
ncbi:MAG: hypothetical protein OEY52_14500 [Gammaproteobacteria bacterium]|nr:hypothetical protein [Gammaproteobacteria bacterium]